MEEMNYFNPNEIEDELSIDLKKIFFTLWSRKWLMLKVGFIIFVLIVLSTFTSTKKYVVDADLYINKSNNSNMAEINPYVIDEMGGFSLNSISDKVMMNELEIMQSPLVIDKVIQDNDLKYKPLFGFIKTKKTGEYLSTEKFLKKKKLKFENKKGTSVITVSYKDKDKELAYGVVSSVITHYIELHKKINSEKSKSDKKILEAEYTKAKANLNSKMNTVSGLPTNAMSGAGNLAAMSAFSKSAQQAMSNLQRQFVAGEKSQLALREESEKVAQLSSKLQWAKLVDEMSDSSKVLILKEPRMLKDYEQTSPKLFVNIILGIVFGVLGGLSSCIIAEQLDKKLCYSKLGNEIIYNVKNEIKNLYSYIISYDLKDIAIISFEKNLSNLLNEFVTNTQIPIMSADLSYNLKNNLTKYNKIMLIAKIGETNSEDYKLIKKILNNLGKDVIVEVLV